MERGLFAERVNADLTSERGGERNGGVEEPESACQWTQGLERVGACEREGGGAESEHGAMMWWCCAACCTTFLRIGFWERSLCCALTCHDV